MKKLKLILTALIILFVSPFLLYALGNFVPFYESFIVSSGSMEPELMTGSTLYTLKTAPENIRVGDTITYADGGRFTTHKVIEKRNQSGEISFKTKGIANENPDPGYVSGDELVGKKIFSIPFMGYLITWAGTSAGVLTLIFLPATLIILLELKEIASEIEVKGVKDIREIAPAIAAGLLILFMSSTILFANFIGLQGLNLDFRLLGAGFVGIIIAAIILLEVEGRR